MSKFFGIQKVNSYISKFFVIFIQHTICEKIIIDILIYILYYLYYLYKIK